MPVAVKGAFPYEMAKDIDKIFFDQYTQAKPEYTLLAKMDDFPIGDTYTESEMTGLGAWERIYDAEPVSYDIPAEGHKKSVSPFDFGKGFQITRNTINDDVHGNWKKMPATLGKGAAQIKEIQFWNLFNNGFSGGGETCWDAGAIFASHTRLKSLTAISNLGSADLDDTSLKAAFEHYDALEDESGFRMAMSPSLLLIPTELKWTANTLQKATGRVWSYNDQAKGTVLGTTPDTGYHAPGPLTLPNLIQPSYGIVDEWGIMVSHFLTDEDAWFLLSKEHDFRFWWKQQMQLESKDDFNTRSRLYQATMRFRAFVMSWRGAYGTPGA